MIIDGTNGLTFNDATTQDKAGLVAGATIATGTITTLTSTTLSDGTNSTSSTNSIRGSAKAWVRFNGNATPTITAAYNVSSVTYVSAGIWNITFATALSSNSFCVVMGQGENSVANQTSNTSYNYATTGLTVGHFESGANRNTGNFGMSVAIFL
jgi:hypothetical protein